MSEKLKIREVVEIANIIEASKGLSRNPIKFCLARNYKSIRGVMADFNDKKDELFNDSVALDHEGNSLVKESKKDQVKEIEGMGGSVPYGMFDFGSEEAEDEFNEKLNAILDEEVDVNLKKESLSRQIKVSDEGGKFKECSLEDILEDPNNGISLPLIEAWMEYFLID